MTLNCPVDNEGVPLAFPNEHFILFRPHIEFQVSIQQLGKKKAKGTAHLTSKRIIFVSEKPQPQFCSFDIPISNLYGQNVQMPIFGSTYLQGNSTPFENLLPGNSYFKIYFKNGDCHTFIQILSTLIKQTRRSLGIQQPFQHSNFFNDIRSGKFNFNAFVNPNDPSRIYTQQPAKQ